MMTKTSDQEGAHSAAGPAGAGNSDNPVMDIVEGLDDAAQAEEVRLRDAVASFGRRSFLPLLMVPALLLVSPLSGIPLFSSLGGLTIALVSAQMLWPGRRVIWLPEAMLRRRIEGARARAALDRLHATAKWLDTHTKERLPWLVTRPGSRIIETACLICGCAMPFLEIIPFSSSFLGGAVLLMALGLLARDGLFALCGLLVMGAVGVGVIGVYSAVSMA
jgi:hypothetical protein